MSEARPAYLPPARRGGNQSAAHSGMVKAVLDYIGARGGWVYKAWGGPFSRRGVPDVLACMRHPVHAIGVMVAVECKTGAATLDRDQRYEQSRLERAGALYVVVHTPEDLEAALLAAGLIETPALLAFGGR